MVRHPDLPAFYERLSSSTKPVLTAPVRDLFTSPARPPLRERGFDGVEMPWGLGFEVAGCFGGSTGYQA
ncbi:MAG: hypothetical protein ACI8Y4_004924 [Candidatus Poriferisodalaceae bacterium]|jgi:hypothetical protein